VDPGGIAESLPGIPGQGVEVNVFDGLPVGVVLSVHATAAGGGAHVDPVGRSIASAAKALRVYQGFQQPGTIPISGLPVLGHLPSAQRQDLTGQSLDFDPGQNQESAVECLAL
jgi:hypothetical protein